jgi:molybdate transport system substrate-binding protein
MSMRFILRIATVIATIFPLLHLHAASAADVRVISAGGIKSVLDVLAPQFQQTTGHRIILNYVDGPVVIKAIGSGEAFDVVISLARAMDSLIKNQKVTARSRTDLARAGIGVAVKSGTPKPVIDTVDAFKRTLLNAKSIAYSAGGSSGAQFQFLLKRLGIEDQVKGKLKALTGHAPAEAVARGEADLLVAGSAALIASGIDFVGPIPTELQDYNVFVGGISSATGSPDAAEALLKFLASATANRVMRDKGLEPAGH